MLDLVDETLGAGRHGDPCGDPLSPAWGRAAWAFDARLGEDGLSLPWPRTSAFVNPPFDDCASWLELCARHAAAGREVLSLVPAQPGSKYWRRLVWPLASAVVFVGRPTFGHVVDEDDAKRGRQAGDIVASSHPTDCAVIAYGIEQAKMVRIWSRAGVVVAPVRELATVASSMSSRT